MSPENKNYRHEFKYLCSNAQLELIKNRIEPLMSIDRHAKDNGSYQIRSLYFDDIYNTCFYENEDGVDLRLKFRIRIYNHNSNVINLEIKEKVHGKALKHSCALTREQCEMLMNGIPLENSQSHPYILKKLCTVMRTRLMKPKVIVEYNRVPYVYKNGNVRITFDRNISSSCDVTGFLNESVPFRPIMPVGQHILEVKYDEYLPDFINKQVQLNDLQFTNFSKYYLCMKYNLGGF